MRGTIVRRRIVGFAKAKKKLLPPQQIVRNDGESRTDRAGQSTATQFPRLEVVRPSGGGLRVWLSASIVLVAVALFAGLMSRLAVTPSSATIRNQAAAVQSRLTPSPARGTATQTSAYPGNEGGMAGSPGDRLASSDDGFMAGASLRRKSTTAKEDRVEPARPPQVAQSGECVIGGDGASKSARDLGACLSRYGGSLGN